MTDIASGHAAPLRRPRPMPAWKINFYRQCRLWHGWLSAFAFITLMFFSATGILLNHPGWFAANSGGTEDIRAWLAETDMETARLAPRPAEVLAKLLVANGTVHGVYASGDIDDGEALLRFEGVSGNTSATIDLASGKVEATWQKATALTILNDLHRGKNAGTAWKWLIDLSAGLFLVLSLVGYILFFSLRHRLTQTLILTFGSLAMLAALFIWFVP